MNFLGYDTRNSVAFFLSKLTAMLFAIYFLWFSLVKKLLTHIFFFPMYVLKGVIKQLSEQILTLNERMDEFTCRMEELNSKMSNSIIRASASHQNLPLQSDSCNGSGPTNQFVSHLGNGTLLPHSSSSNQLHKESPLMEEVQLNPIFFNSFYIFFK